MYDDISDFIRKQNGSKPSIDDQVKVAAWLYEKGFIEPDGSFARTSEIQSALGPSLDYQVRTTLGNLESIGIVVNRRPPGSGNYIRHHRSEQNIFDITPERVAELLEPDLERMIQDIQEQDEIDGEVTPRDVASEQLGVSPEDLEEQLTSPPDPIERMNRYDQAVKAIKSADDVTRNGAYDEMGWRNVALRWALTKLAIRIERNGSLPAA